MASDEDYSFWCFVVSTLRLYFSALRNIPSLLFGPFPHTEVAPPDYRKIALEECRLGVTEVVATCPACGWVNIPVFDTCEQCQSLIGQPWCALEQARMAQAQAEMDRMATALAHIVQAGGLYLHEERGVRRANAPLILPLGYETFDHLQQRLDNLESEMKATPKRD